jgi:putative membrane protein
MIAICAMILPGISGSFILVVLGQYLFVLEAVHNRDIPVIIVFSAGCAIGLLAFTKLLRYLLKNHKTITMASLCGLMIGSLRKIWPFKSEAAGQELLKPKHRIQINILPDALDEQTIWAVAMVIVGITVVFLAQYAAGRAERKT